MIKRAGLAIFGFATNMMAYFISDETMGERFIACFLFTAGLAIFTYALCKEGGKNEEKHRSRNDSTRLYFLH